MILDSLLDLQRSAIAFIVFTIVLARLLFNKYGNGINNIPGPLLASCTDYWRLFIVWGRRPELTHIKLHQKYGELVRIGPKTVIVANWDVVRKIYALKAGYVKVSTVDQHLQIRADEYLPSLASIQCR
jgi:hypothetical protein